ncbi:glycosyltransferase family 39 protein, partial [Omnitrophica bacterium]|nr:glycosyltransferase family 39 protein [Candidatus Omnitrophota bacterium]
MKKGEFINYLILFISALVPRAVKANLVYICDTPRWISRAQIFIEAFFRNDLRLTYTTFHPGVIFTWLAGLMMKWKGLIFLEPHYGRFRIESTITPEAFSSLRLYASLPQHIVSIAGILFIYYLVKRLLGDKKVALVSGLFLAFSPLYIGYTKNSFYQDGLLAIFGAISFLLFLIYINERRMSFLVMSGVSLGLALLSKLSAVTLIITAFLISFFSGSLDPEHKSVSFKMLLAWISVGLIVFFLLWPSMWVRPAHTISRIIFALRRYGSVFDYPMLFMGNPVFKERLPGLFYYAVMLTLKLTPIMLVLFASFFLIVFRKKRFRSELRYPFLLSTFVIVYFSFMSFVNNKYTWYILPAIPLIAVLSAVAARHIIAKYIRKVPYQNIALSLLVLLQLASAAYIFPYFGLYHSPLWGSFASASRLFSEYWGQCLEQPASYINAQPGAENAVVAAWPKVYHMMNKGYTVGLHNYYIADYVVFYQKQIERGVYEHAFRYYMKNIEPAYVHTFKGFVTAHVFKNTPEILYTMQKKNLSFPANIGNDITPENREAYRFRRHFLKTPQPWYFRYFFIREDPDRDVVVTLKLTGFNNTHKVIVNGRDAGIRLDA